MSGRPPELTAATGAAVITADVLTTATPIQEEAARPIPGSRGQGIGGFAPLPCTLLMSRVTPYRRVARSAVTMICNASIGSTEQIIRYLLGTRGAIPTTDAAVARILAARAGFA